MRSLKQLKDDLAFVNECRSLFEVIQQTALSQLHWYEERSKAFQPMSRIIQERCLPMLPAEAATHPLLSGGKQGSLVMVFTADEGLVGTLYTDVVRQALSHATEPSHWIALGERGARLLTDRGVMPQRLAMPSDDTSMAAFWHVSQRVVRQMLRDGLRTAWVVFPQFVSKTSQVATAKQLIPLRINANQALEDLVIEPSVERVVERLIQLWVWYSLIEAFWSSRLAELAARALHLEEAIDELNQRAKRAHREFFKVMHERADVMVRETCLVKRWR